MKDYNLDPQIKLLKEWEKTKRLIWCEDEDEDVNGNVYFTTNGMVAYSIPKRRFLISIESLKKREAPSSALRPLFEMKYTYEPSVVQGIVFGKNGPLVELKDKNEVIYVEEKLIKPFLNGDFCFFKASNGANIIGIMLTGTYGIYAIICIVKRSGNERSNTE